MLEHPLAIDRRLNEVARSARSFRRVLREGRGDDHAFELVGRRVSRELLRELAEATVDPLAPALLRFAQRLYESHVLAELDRQHATALRVERHRVDAPLRGEFTLRELIGHALANTQGESAAFLDVLAERGARASDFVLRRVERHVELRSELARFIPANLDLPGDDVLAAAPELCARTQSALEALAPRTLADLLALGLGRESRATWPARLTARSVADLLGDSAWLAHATPEPFDVPASLGAASWLRALFAFGASLRSVLPSSSQPFVLAHDPYGLERATFGSLFALLPALPTFARRRLEVLSASASDHRRTLARVLLVAVRELVLRVSLRAPSLSGASDLRRTYPELSHAALGVELPPNLVGVVFTPRAGDAQRLAGLLLAFELGARLVETHDEDWFRNPRAIEELRERARGPAETLANADELARGTTLLARFLDEAL